MPAALLTARTKLPRRCLFTYWNANWCENSTMDLSSLPEMLSKGIKLPGPPSPNKGCKLSCRAQCRLQTTRTAAAMWTSLEPVRSTKSQAPPPYTYVQNHNLHFNKTPRKFITLRSTGIGLIQLQNKTLHTSLLSLWTPVEFFTGSTCIPQPT